MTQFPALYTIDTFGRRNLLLFTFPNMAWCLFAAAGCFQMNEGNSARLPLIAFFIYLFTAFYSPGEWSFLTCVVLWWLACDRGICAHDVREG